MRKLKLIVQDEQAGQKIRTLLRKEFAFSESRLSHLKYVDGAVLKNGCPVRLIDVAKEGDCIEVFLPGGGEGAFPLPLLYEDEDLLMINKPAGMVVHGVAGGADTVESLWRASRGEAFHGVNRLDRNTSGVMVAAKNGYIHDRLRKLLHTDAFCREYLALVCGRVEHPTGEIELPLLRRAGKSLPDPEGKEALTCYEVLTHGHGCTLLKLKLFTGRTHQIRAHCAAIGHPLLGDELYGGEKGGRTALHSWRVTLRRPLQGDRITVTAPLAEDLVQLCEERGISARERI